MWNGIKDRNLRMLKNVYLLMAIAVSMMMGFYPVNSDLEAYSYIEDYEQIAIIEMYRTGVPASITMAQAIHESQVGKSALAQRANNHFGIKCKSYWQGKTYMHRDDDFNNRGELIESCFSAYDTVFDSYIDHSNFLKQTKHYGPLFDLDRTDYVGWCYGLKQCGYATDIKYAQKLIRIIEKYGLSTLDHSDNPFKSRGAH